MWQLINLFCRLFYSKAILCDWYPTRFGVCFETGLSNCNRSIRTWNIPPCRSLSRMMNFRRFESCPGDQAWQHRDEISNPSSNSRLLFLTVSIHLRFWQIVMVFRTVEEGPWVVLMNPNKLTMRSPEKLVRDDRNGSCDSKSREREAMIKNEGRRKTKRQEREERNGGGGSYTVGRFLVPVC